MNISDFNMPTTHPFGMCTGYDNANEKEHMLSVILSRCVQAGAFIPVETKYSHPTMVTDGLLKEVGERTYELTRKAKGMLYAYYGKEE
jgi:hypothetical protein